MQDLNREQKSFILYALYAIKNLNMVDPNEHSKIDEIIKILNK